MKLSSHNNQEEQRSQTTNKRTDSEQQ